MGSKTIQRLIICHKGHRFVLYVRRISEILHRNGNMIPWNELPQKITDFRVIFILIMNGNQEMLTHCIFRNTIGSEYCAIRDTIAQLNIVKCVVVGVASNVSI